MSFFDECGAAEPPSEIPTIKELIETRIGTWFQVKISTNSMHAFIPIRILNLIQQSGLVDSIKILQNVHPNIGTSTLSLIVQSYNFNSQFGGGILLGNKINKLIGDEYVVSIERHNNAQKIKKTYLDEEDTVEVPQVEELPDTAKLNPNAIEEYMERISKNAEA